MKILYLSEILGPHDYRFLKRIIERGLSVTLLTYRQSLEQAGLEAKYYDVRSIAGLKIIHRPGLASNSALSFLRKRFDIMSVIRSENPDVIHAGWIQTSGFLAALSGFHPYIMMPWGSDIIHFSKNSIRNRIASRFAISNADMITVDCEYEKRILTDDFKYPSEKIIVMPWDTDIEVFNKGNYDLALKDKLGLTGKKVMLMMRIFRPEYGIEDFIRALPMVKASNPDARALMLGYGPIEDRLRDLAESLGVMDYIVWTGYVPQREVVKYINISDIYVSTSLRDGSSSSLLESMSCGLPAVVSDIPGNIEWIKDGVNGLVVRKGDARSIADGLNRLLKDEALLKKMSMNNIQKVRDNADFSKNIEKLFKAYYLLATSH